MLTRFALSAAIALALAACGGGGSGGKPASMTQQPNMPVVDTDGDGVADAQDAFPRDASETMDTDGDGVGDNADAFPNLASETMDMDMDGVGDNADAFPQNASLSQLGAGLTVGDDPIYATTAANTRAVALADPSNKFRVYSAGIRRVWSDQTVEITDRFSITALRSDGDYGLRVTYGDSEGMPTEQEIHFPKELVDSGGTFAHEELGYWLWAHTSVPFNGMNYSHPDSYVGFIGTVGPNGRRNIAVYGLETPNNALPTGTATYSATAYAEMFDSSIGDINTSTGRTTLRGSTTLNADFASNSLTGRIDVDRINPLGSSDSVSVNGIGFDIDGVTGDGQLTATVTGTGVDSSHPLANLQGFEGDAVGAFYGPEGQEGPAAVFAAERDMNGVHRTIHGLFWGAKPE